VSAGAVRVRRDGRLQAVLRDYIPHSMDEQLIRLWGTVIADVATTYVHNLTRTQKGSRRFERSAVNQQIPLSAIEEYQRLLDSEGQRFLELIDTWLTARQRTVRSGKGAEPTVRLGVGLYQIQDDPTGETPMKSLDPVSSQTHSPVVSPECRIPAHPPDGSGGTGGNSGFGPSKLPRRRHGHFSGSAVYL